MPKLSPGTIGSRTLEDITSLILQSHDLDQTLQNIVTLVAKRMKTEVCSIYLLDAGQQPLRLRATRGLAKESVGKVTMQLNEGLIGLAAEERRVISIQEPQRHPRFRYFAETGEELYHSFLGIPPVRPQRPVGVIAIQTRDPRKFSAEEISALRRLPTRFPRSSSMPASRFDPPAGQSQAALDQAAEATIDKTARPPEPHPVPARHGCLSRGPCSGAGPPA